MENILWMNIDGEVKPGDYYRQMYGTGYIGQANEEDYKDGAYKGLQKVVPTNILTEETARKIWDAAISWHADLGYVIGGAPPDYPDFDTFYKQLIDQK